ncbi:Dolichyl-phosphate-mannose--protein O-mannosyl transferase [Methanophagales archaeon]|nr:Dolichyl-phosphate-mannose--protein O-mannosyl transferase [Methanophagales archaeon]
MEKKKQWEIVSVSALVFVFLILASLNLGSVEMPCSYWQPSRTGVADVATFDFGAVKQVKELYIFVGDANRTKVDVYGDNDVFLSSYDNNPAEHVHFCSWERMGLGHRSTSTITFVFGPESWGEIGEIIVVSSDNQKIAPMSVRGETAMRLADEQSAIKLPVTQRYGAYFDEMYFARTAHEHLNLEEPYESTHPPLGKLIIALGILCCGMNPLGWRIVGVIAAAVMIPIMFIFGKRMFKSSVAGFFAAFLLTFEFMHLSLARLATGEIFILFFTLMIFYFAFDYFSKQEDGAKKGTSLFICIIFVGLCFAVKWTAAFSFIAILTLLIISNIRTRKSIFSDFKIVFAGLCVFAAIYIATYIPYMFSGTGHALFDIDRVPLYLEYISEYLSVGNVSITPPAPLTVFDSQLGMFGYHSLINATHPFSSPWWSWPLMLKPLWVYSNSWDSMVSTIVLMGNPAIWWGSIPALILIAAKLVRDKIRREKTDFVLLFILIPFLLLWLPYALISRILFIYHFAPEVPFMVFAITYWLNNLWLDHSQRHEKKIVVNRILVISFLILTAVLFCLFYPVISGYPVSCEYKECLRWLSGWLF